MNRGRSLCHGDEEGIRHSTTLQWHTRIREPPKKGRYPPSKWFLLFGCMPLKNKVQCGDLNSITEERAEQKRNADCTPFDCRMVNRGYSFGQIACSARAYILGDISNLQQGELRGISFEQATNNPVIMLGFIWFQSVLYVIKIACCTGLIRFSMWYNQTQLEDGFHRVHSTSKALSTHSVYQPISPHWVFWI